MFGRCSAGVRRVFGGCSGGVRFVLCCCVIPVFGPFSPHVRFGICFRPIQWMPWMFGHGNVQNAYSACRESMFFTKSSWISTFSSRNAGFSKFLKILDFEAFPPCCESLHRPTYVTCGHIGPQSHIGPVVCSSACGVACLSCSAHEMKISWQTGCNEVQRLPHYSLNYICMYIYVYTYIHKYTGSAYRTTRWQLMQQLFLHAMS